MRKNGKKLLGSMLALTVAATSVFGTCPALRAETITYVADATQNNAEAVLTIHAKGSEQLYLYAWDDKGSVTAAFPGDKMDADSATGDGWYCMQINKAIKGFIVSAGSNKLTGDVTDKTSGEYWFDGSIWSDKNPNGGAGTPGPATTAPGKETPTPATPTPSSATDKIKITKVSPEDGSELSVGTQNVVAEATSTIGDGVVYYKFEVTCDGKAVGNAYYSKNNSCSIDVEDGKTYKVTVNAQAHSYDNEQAKPVTVTYKGVKEGGATAAPGKNTPVPGENTPVPATNAPGKNTPAPGKDTPDPGPTAPGKNTPDPGPTASADPSVTTPPVSDGFTNDFYVALSVDKKSGVKAGTKVKLSASSEHGEGEVRYTFYYKLSGKTYTIASDLATPECSFVPTKAGSYTLGVTAIDSYNDSTSDKLGSFKVVGMSISKLTKPSAKSCKVKKKLTFKVTTKNSVGTVKIKLVIKKAGKTVNSKAANYKYKTGKSVTWKPTKKGKYTVYVYVKDKYTTVSKKVSVTVK